MFDPEFLIKILHIAPPLMVAVIIHEIAHGYVAYRLGDPTAKLANRINLNPLVHIDLFMTIILPLMLILSNTGVVFGGAKPVPVDPRYFKNPRKGMLWVALAGPVSNLILSLISYGLLIVLILNANLFSSYLFNLFMIWFSSSIYINIVLALFNMFPIPPLDGGRIMVGILPLKLALQYAKLERFGFFILIILIYYGVPQKVIAPVLEFVEGIL
jgi:Zn-dependent protease